MDRSGGLPVSTLWPTATFRCANGHVLSVTPATATGHRQGSPCPYCSEPLEETHSHGVTAGRGDFTGVFVSPADFSELEWWREFSAKCVASDIGIGEPLTGRKFAIVESKGSGGKGEANQPHQLDPFVGEAAKLLSDRRRGLKLLDEPLDDDFGPLDPAECTGCHCVHRAARAGRTTDCCWCWTTHPVTG